MHDDLEQLLDQVPVVAGRPRTVEELSGGLTNRNLKVCTPDGAFVVRCFRGDASLLDIDRDAEHHNTVAAAEAGVGAPVLDYRPDLGMLVIGFIDGVTLTNRDLQGPGMLPRVAEAMRTLHAGPRFSGDFDMFARQADYLAVVRRRGFALPAGYPSYERAFAQVRAALAAHDDGTVPCNNDLLAGNVVDDGERLWLIDYEYSGNNDACFELGNTSTECDLDPDQVEELVTAYFGRPLRHKIARTRLQALVSAYGWALWGMIQAAVSTIDYDFTAWGTERYEKAAAGFGAATFPRLLEEARRDD